VIVYIEYSHGL